MNERLGGGGSLVEQQGVQMSSRVCVNSQGFRSPYMENSGQVAGKGF